MPFLHISKLFVLFFLLKCYKLFIAEVRDSQTEIKNKIYHFSGEKFCRNRLFAYLCHEFTNNA
jgi:hypothetical protein